MNIYDVLSPQEIEQYKSQGYTEQEMQNLLGQSINEVQAGSNLQSSYAQAQQMKLRDPRNFASHSVISGGFNENLIQWQLELDSILERVEHMLRGDKPTFIHGNLIFMPTEDDAKRILNDFGVAEIMRCLSMYINQDTILSNYREETIDDKMLDLGFELTDLFFLKYESMGLNTLEKRKLYPILVRQLVDIVHSTYLRALHGGERESLRESRQVSQSESLGPGGITINAGQQQKERGMLNPMRWIRGKYA